MYVLDHDDFIVVRERASFSLSETSKIVQIESQDA